MVKKIAISVGSALLFIVVALLLLMAVIFYGPSQTARDLLVVSVTETSALKFIPYIYLPSDEVEAILEGNKVLQTDEVTDTDLYDDFDEEEVDKDKIELVDVVGDTYKGFMLIVHDPSRVVVSTPDEFGEGHRGIKVTEMIEKEGGIAGTNAGGFADHGGVGNGGTPLGTVISHGELMWGWVETNVVGFDAEDRLVVGSMTANEAVEMGLRDAVSFEPALIINGESLPIVGTGGGLNPRTAIGQRADGAVLLLIIDGRQAHSLGASYSDLQKVMVEFGAVNASNLDGGSSTTLYYEGELISTPASLYGPRDLPTGWIVI